MCYRRQRHEGQLSQKLEKRKSGLFWHIMRRDGMESLVTMGKCKGKKRGRQRKKMLDGLTSWHGKESITTLIQRCWMA